MEITCPIETIINKGSIFVGIQRGILHRPIRVKKLIREKVVVVVVVVDCGVKWIGLNVAL